MMKTIRITAIVMLLFVYFLTYGVLPQVLAAGKDTPMIVVAHRAGAKVAPENTISAIGAPSRMACSSAASVFSGATLAPAR